MSNNKYSIGTGTLGDDKFDEAEDTSKNQNSSPSSKGLFDGFDSSNSYNNSTPSQTKPSFLDNSNSVPSFLEKHTTNNISKSSKYSKENGIKDSESMDEDPQVDIKDNPSLEDKEYIPQKKDSSDSEDYDYLANLYPDINFQETKEKDEEEKYPDFMEPIGQYEQNKSDKVQKESDKQVNYNQGPQSIENYTYTYNTPSNNTIGNQNSYNGDYKSGSTIFSKILSLVFSLIIFSIVTLGAIYAAYTYFEPAYFDEKVSREAEEQFNSIAVESNRLKQSVDNYYNEIIENSGTEFDISKYDLENYISQAELINDRSGRILNEIKSFKDDYSDSGILEFDTNINSIENFVLITQEYSNNHIVVGQELISIRENLDELEKSLIDRKLNAFREDISDVKSQIDTSRDAFTEKFYGVQRLDNFSYYSYYFNYLDSQIRIVNELEELLESNNIEPTDLAGIASRLGVFIQSNESAERIYYNQLSENNSFKELTNAIENMRENIEVIGDDTIPPEVYDLIDQIEQSIN